MGGAMNPHALRRTIIIAVCLYVFDGLVVGEGVIGVFVFLVAFLAGGIRILTAAHSKDHTLARLHAARIGVYFLMAVAIVGTLYVNNRIARHQAERLIAACRQYETKYHRLPDRLQELVPEFLPGVPRAKYTVMYGDFTYLTSEKSYRLYYVAFPPLTRAIYSFKSGRWSTFI
jgi:hypothetical protein